MIAGFKTKFEDGTPTFFLPAIYKSLMFLGQEHLMNKPFEYDEMLKVKDIPHCKIHTIRAGNRWRAGMTMHMATGVRTKNYNCFAELVCKSVQDISIVFYNSPRPYITNVIIDNVIHTFGISESIARMDGLSYNRFIDWFFSASQPFGENNEFKRFEGQIIHWTNFKYNSH